MLVSFVSSLCKYRVPIIALGGPGGGGPTRDVVLLVRMSDDWRALQHPFPNHADELRHRVALEMGSPSHSNERRPDAGPEEEVLKSGRQFS